MENHGLSLDLGMLCRCCDHSYRVPDFEGLTASQRKAIEDLCRLCSDSFKLSSVPKQPIR
jgi:hypothetical protein